MRTSTIKFKGGLHKAIVMCSSIIVGIVSLLPSGAQALPAFARQTGQNCVACHAGGQFPELTPYGRIFKLTGYTIGERTIPLSAMAVLTANKVKVNDQTQGHTQDGTLAFNTASLFIAGKISDKTGGFAQITYNNYDTLNPDTSRWTGHSGADNMDFRYADRLIDVNRDLIYGLTLHNNPTVQDVWMSAPAWGPATVPGSTGAGAGALPKMADGLGQQVAGVGAYAYWNKTLYAELTGYRTGDGLFSFMTQGVNKDHGPQTYLKGMNPYWRLALTHEWGPHNAMIGVSGMNVDIYPDSADPTGLTDRYRDTSIDAQYQYLLDPHTVTAEASYIHEKQDLVANLAATNPSDTIDSFRTKVSYVYQAKYGATLSYFDVRGSTNNNANTNTRGWTPEIFWTPVQYIRLGLQYTTFNKVNGVSSNTDGAGRNAKDDNTLLFYVWGAY
ncbi:MAG: cytochrome C [Burkholderiales bacterium]